MIVPGSGVFVLTSNGGRVFVLLTALRLMSKSLITINPNNPLASSFPRRRESSKIIRQRS